MEFSKSASCGAAYIMSHVNEIPETAVLTEKDLKIIEVFSFPVTQIAQDMYGKIKIGYINEKFVLYKKLNKNDDALYYKDLIKLLKIKNVTVIVNAVPVKKADLSFMQIRDFIRFVSFNTSDTGYSAKSSGGIYGLINGEPTDAELRAFKILGADGVGENRFPAVFLPENLNTQAVMAFKEAEYELNI